MVVRRRENFIPHSKLHKDPERHADSADTDPGRHERNHRHQYLRNPETTRSVNPEEICRER